MKRRGSPQAFAETLALLQEKRIRVHVLPTGEAGITPRCGYRLSQRVAEVSDFL
jgi:hypothetical protein